MIDSSVKSLFAAWDRRLLSIFLFGFSSGLPFLLTLSTLTIWLKESGLTNATIGLFVAVTIPYTLKFLWGPMVDLIKIPVLSNFLGQRRSWALLAQGLLVIMLLGLGRSNPAEHIFETALWALGVSFWSAIQDIVVEAYRIEIIDENQKGFAASSTYLGWRLGTMMSGAGALYLAAIFSWSAAYELMALLMGIGILTTLLSPSPKASSVKQYHPHASQGLWTVPRIWEWIRSLYGTPLKALLKTADFRIVLLFILFYKIGDTSLSVMNTPFLLEIGFTKLEIAHVVKLFGISATIFGAFAGGIFLNRFGLLAGLMFCTVLQIVSSLMFVIQALIGYDLSVLFLTIGVENFTSGLGAAAFIAYLSSLCRAPYTATHYALLTSFGSFARILLSAGAGFLADILPWPTFFACTTVACLPCLFLLIQASRHFSPLSFLKQS